MNIVLLNSKWNGKDTLDILARNIDGDQLWAVKNKQKKQQQNKLSVGLLLCARQGRPTE